MEFLDGSLGLWRAGPARQERLCACFARLGKIFGRSRSGGNAAARSDNAAEAAAAEAVAAKSGAALSSLQLIPLALFLPGYPREARHRDEGHGPHGQPWPGARRWRNLLLGGPPLHAGGLTGVQPSRDSELLP